MSTSTIQIEQLRTTTVATVVQAVSARYFGAKVEAWKTKHLNQLAEVAFDAAAAFGFIQGVPATAIDRRSHLVGYWIEGEHTGGFEAVWEQATKLVNTVVDFKMETMLASTGGARTAISADIVAGVLVSLHTQDLFVAKLDPATA